MRDALTDPVYRALFVVLVTQGIIFGGQTPFIPLWARDVLGADTVAVGVLQALSALVAIAFGLAYGIRSDRTRRRTRWLLVAFCAGIPARLLLPVARDYWPGALLTAIAGMGTFSLLFALLGDWLRVRRPPGAAQIHSAIRLAFALGWQIGAAGAGQVVARLGYGGFFLITAVLQVVTVLFMLAWVRDAPQPTEPAPGADAPTSTAAPRARSPHHAAPPTQHSGLGASPLGTTQHSRRAMWLYLATTFLVGAAMTARMTLLPLYMAERLGTDPGAVGIVFAVEAFYEMPLFLLVGRLADRFGTAGVLPLGLAAGALYYAGLGLAGAYWQLLVLELLFAALIAAVNNLGILYVQDLLPRRGGTALAFYNAASRLGPLVSGPALGWLVTRAGWSSGFFTASALVAAAIGTFDLSRRARNRSHLPASP